MPGIYSTLCVAEPDYGERIVRVHGGIHHAGVSHTTAVDLVTGERLLMPISTRWDSATQRDVRVCAEGWSWRPIPLAEAERRAGLPKGSLPPHSDTTRTDLWADERMRNPAFIALLTVLSAHPEVVFYSRRLARLGCISPAAPVPAARATRAPLTAPTQTSSMGDERATPPIRSAAAATWSATPPSLSRLLSGATSPAVDRAPDTFDVAL